MLGDELIGNITVPSENLIRGLLEADDNEKTYPGWSTICPPSVKQKQEALHNAAPNRLQVVIADPVKPAHYKMFSGPNGDYLFSERCVPVQLVINNPLPGLELSVIARYKPLPHQHKAVQACHEHSIMTPAESQGMDLGTPNKAAFVLMAGYSRRVQYDFEGLHPIARVTLNAGAQIDELNLVFPCLSSCKPHKDSGSLILFHLDIRDIDSREIVSSYEFTARVARNVLARASNKYEEDMLGKTTPHRPAKRPMPCQGDEGLDDAAEGVEVVAKQPKREHGNERKDHASDLRVVIGNPEFNQDGEERRDNASGGKDIGAYHPEADHDASDVKDMADYILSRDLFAKEAVNRMFADIQAGASSSTLASDDDCNIRNGNDGASNQSTLIEASHSSNKSMVNIGASSGSSLGMARTDQLPIQMVNNQTSMVPIANNSALTVVNQNQISPEGCSLSSSTSLDCSNNPLGSLQESAISDPVAFLVTNLKNPESDCHKIKQYVESLGALCSQEPVFNQIFPS